MADWTVGIDPGKCVHQATRLNAGFHPVSQDMASGCFVAVFLPCTPIKGKQREPRLQTSPRRPRCCAPWAHAFHQSTYRNETVCQSTPWAPLALGIKCTEYRPPTGRWQPTGTAAAHLRTPLSTDGVTDSLIKQTHRRFRLRVAKQGGAVARLCDPLLVKCGTARSYDAHECCHHETADPYPLPQRPFVLVNVTHGHALPALPSSAGSDTCPLRLGPLRPVHVHRIINIGHSRRDPEEACRTRDKRRENYCYA